MSHDHDLDPQRDHQSTSTTTTDADSTAPGRASRSAQLRRTDTPTMSGILMRKASGAVGADPEQAVAQASGSSGGALPDDLRAKFESSLGVDLSGVRVHTGSESAQATSAVGAHAYAMGNDIHFAAGQYDPGSEQGQHLIAHEVAHTVQQRGAPATRQNKLAVSSPGDAAEVEADHAAAAMVAGRPAMISSMPSSGILHRSASGPPPAEAPADDGKGKAAASGGVKVTNKSVEVDLGGSYTLSTKGQWVNGSIGLTVTGKGTAEFPSVTPDGVDVELSAGADSEGVKTGGETTIAADKVKWERAAKTKVQQQASEQANEKFAVESVEWEPIAFKAGGEVGADHDANAKKKLGATLSTTVTVKFKGMKPYTCIATIIGFEQENGTPTVKLPGITLTMPIDEWTVKEDLGGGSSLTGSAKASCVLNLSLSQEAVARKIAEETAKKVAEKGAQKVAETAVEGAAEAVTSEAAAAATLNTALIAEVAGFGAIAVSMGAAFVIGANQVTEIKEYEAKARAAIAGYVNGAMTALGCSGGGKGDPQFVIQGMAAYAGRLGQMLASAKSKLPAGHNLSDADIMAQLQVKIVEQQGAIRAKIEGEAKPAITKQFVEAYYRENQGWLFKTEDRRDAERIATRLGQPEIRLDENGNAYELED